MHSHEAMTAHLRRVLAEESATLVAFARRFHADDGHPLEAAAEAVLLDLVTTPTPAAEAFFIEENGTPIGYAVLAYGFSIEYGGRDAFIDDLFIFPDFRNRGLGRSVLHQLEAAAQAAGAKAVHLELMPDNAAGRLYLRAGFRDRGSRLLTKRLAPPGGNEK